MPIISTGDGYYDERAAAAQEFEDMLKLVDPKGAAALQAMQPDPEVTSDSMVVTYPSAA